MAWETERTDEFRRWSSQLSPAEERSLRAAIELLEERGPVLEFPHSSNIRSSRHGNMRELRIRNLGLQLRVFYAFDPRRVAVLLLGGDKKSDGRFYARNVPRADALYDDYLEDLRRKGFLP